MFETLNKFFNFCNETDRKKFYNSIVLSVISAIFNAMKIAAIGVVLRDFLGDGITMKTVWTSLIIMLVSILGVYITRYKSTMLQTEAGYGTAANKRIEIAEHMRYMPMGYFNENSLGQIMSVTTNTMENLSDVGTRVVLLVTSGAITTLVITAFIFFFDWRVGLFILAGIAVYYFANALMRKHSKVGSANKVKSDTDLVEKVLEYIKGISEVKSYHLSGKYNKRLEKSINDNVKANTDLEIDLIPYMTLQNFVVKMIGVGIVFLSLFLYTTGEMTLLNCIMMVICSFMVMENLETAGAYSALLRVVDISVDKANAILSIKPMDIEGEEITPKTHNIKAENIDFAYGTKKIIDDVSISIPENTTTAIVGPSGSGKTTICHLLSRFWDVDAGKVTLDGKDIREYSLDSLMKNFSFVFQNVYLFKDTIANNIRFGQDNANREDIIEAAKKAKCHDFIMALPNGYDTIIGERGGSLSGGERQRLSIARAIMKDAPIIVLDEATANVDPENEKDLLSAIEELTKHKTIIMIAHRLKTVEKADNILVVDKGRIVQQGTHDELMKQDGIYRNFVNQRSQAIGWKL